jgi:hypothetical protein
MKNTLLLAVLLLSGCATTRPQPDTRLTAEIIPPVICLDTPAVQLRLDSVRVLTPRTWLERAAAKVGLTTRRPTTVIGKKSTINNYYAPATVTTAGKKATVAVGAGAVASVIEKKAGPAQVATDSSLLNAVSGGGNLQAVHGNDNRLEATKQDTTEEAPGIGATVAAKLFGPLGIVVAAGVVVIGVVLWRKKKQAQSLIS